MEHKVNAMIDYTFASIAANRQNARDWVRFVRSRAETMSFDENGNITSATFATPQDEETHKRSERADALLWAETEKRRQRLEALERSERERQRRESDKRSKRLDAILRRNPEAQQKLQQESALRNRWLSGSPRR
jgi:hypothetical protein